MRLRHPERSGGRDQQSGKRNEVKKEQHVMKLRAQGACLFLCLLNLSLGAVSVTSLSGGFKIKFGKWDIATLVGTV
jgi:hypothetical protein